MPVSLFPSRLMPYDWNKKLFAHGSQMELKEKDRPMRAIIAGLETGSLGRTHGGPKSPKP